MMLPYFSGTLSLFPSFFTSYEPLLAFGLLSLPPIMSASSPSYHIQFMADDPAWTNCLASMVWLSWDQLASSHCFFLTLRLPFRCGLKAMTILLPSGKAASIQKMWDNYKVERLAVSLYTIPISSVALKMDDNTFHVAVGLHLGSSL